MGVSISPIKSRKFQTDNHAMQWIKQAGWHLSHHFGRLTEARGERRITRRYTLGEGIHCALGELFDLSSTGMGVRAPRKPVVKPGHVLSLAIRSGEGAIQLRGQIARVVRCARGRYEIGIAFQELEPATQRRIDALARIGHIPTRHGPLPLRDSTAAKKSRDKSGSTQKHTLKVTAEVPDPYGALGVLPNATHEEVRAAYRQIVQRMQLPPVAANGKRTDRAAVADEKPLPPDEVRAAFDLLEDRFTREAYDRLYVACAG